MMPAPLPLLLIALSTALAAPSAYNSDNLEMVPQKRAALVLDRLLVALQKALREYDVEPDDGPRIASLRAPIIEEIDMSPYRRSGKDNSGRGKKGTGKGTVVKCFFNPVTCF